MHQSDLRPEVFVVNSRMIFACCAAFVLVVSCKEEQKAPAPGAATPSSAMAPPIVAVGAAELGAFGALPKQMASEKNPITEAKVELGRMLYYDKRFSKAQDLSCNSCHALDAYGVDGQDFSTGHKGQKGGRNAPTVYNAAGHIAQFWDGRAPDVEKQAQGPVLNPVEMAMPSEKDVLAVINSIPEYVDRFKKAFPSDASPVTYDNFGNAIGAFERELVTPGRWDEMLGGNAGALTNPEKTGLKLFVSTGCTACHAGAYVGGAAFQKVGAVKAWPNQKDQGRFEVTKQEADKMSFKVPSLRNVAKTGPYFHDSSAKTLAEAVQMMAEFQLGKTLSADDTASIVSFLEALTGNIPKALIKEPELPKSTDKTPKPAPN